jgi:nitroimidazol reductase NimA-like FMN-containing flavoprotein (pyridoxamine 5'-phosphate oxidase superfamily)
VTRSDAIARAREARVGRMATVTGEGGPHVVPFVFPSTVHVRLSSQGREFKTERS